MPSESRFSKTVIDIDNRSFTVQILLFDNGSFVSITEGQEKIGGMIASIGTGTVPIITGINIISTFIPKELENKTAKTLIAKIKEIVEK